MLNGRLRQPLEIFYYLHFLSTMINLITFTKQTLHSINNQPNRTVWLINKNCSFLFRSTYGINAIRHESEADFMNKNWLLSLANRRTLQRFRLRSGSVWFLLYWSSHMHRERQYVCVAKLYNLDSLAIVRSRTHFRFRLRHIAFRRMSKNVFNVVQIQI